MSDAPTQVQTSSLWMFADNTEDEDDGLMDYDAAAAGDDEDTDAFIANAQAQLDQLGQQQPQPPSVELAGDSQTNFDDDYVGSWDTQQANLERYQQAKDATMLARLAGEKKKQVQQQVEKFQQWNPTMYIKEIRANIAAMSSMTAEELATKERLIGNFNAMIEVCDCVTHLTHLTHRLTVCLTDSPQVPR